MASNSASEDTLSSTINPNIHDILMLVDMTPPTFLKNVYKLYNQKQMSKDSMPYIPNNTARGYPGPGHCFYMLLLLLPSGHPTWLRTHLAVAWTCPRPT